MCDLVILGDILATLVEPSVMSVVIESLSSMTLLHTGCYTRATGMCVMLWMVVKVCMDVKYETQLVWGLA